MGVIRCKKCSKTSLVTPEVFFCGYCGAKFADQGTNVPALYELNQKASDLERKFVFQKGFLPVTATSLTIGWGIIKFSKVLTSLNPYLVLYGFFGYMLLAFGYLFFISYLSERSSRKNFPELYKDKVKSNS